MLQGKPGTGKTHAACAALIANMERGGKMRQVRFATFGGILREIKDAFNGGSESDVVARYTGCYMLVIDDFGKEKLTEWGASVLFDIINARWEEERPTIITTNYTAAELLARLESAGDKALADAMASRFSQYKRVVLTGKDRRRE